MKKNLIIFLFLFASFFLIYSSVQAHILQINGSIGAVMHIDPDDDPIVGKPSNFFFEFKDKTNKFSPQNCTCIASIIENNKEIYSTSLFTQNNTDLTNASFSFTFPQKDIYTIILRGAPINGSDFQTFSLQYDVRVERVYSSNNRNTGSTSPFFFQMLIVIIGILVGVGIVVRDVVKNKKK